MRCLVALFGVAAPCCAAIGLLAAAPARAQEPAAAPPEATAPAAPAEAAAPAEPAAAEATPAPAKKKAPPMAGEPLGEPEPDAEAGFDLPPPPPPADAPAAPAPAAEPAPVAAPAPAAEPAPVAAPAVVAPAPAPAPEAVPAIAPPAAPEATPAMATGEAAPAPAGQSAADLLGGTKPGQDFSLTVSLGFGAGVQTDDDMTSAQTSLGITATRKVTPWLTVEGSLSPYVELTRMPGENRRADLDGRGSYVRLLFTELYKEAVSGVKLGASFTYMLPLTYTDLAEGNPKYGTLAPAVTLSRAFGDFAASLGAQMSFPLWVYARAKLQCEPAPGASCPDQPWGNSWNTKASLTPSASVVYKHGRWSGLARFGLSQSWTHGPGESTEPSYPNEHANQRYSFLFSAGAGYDVTDELALTVGLGNAGPQTTNGRDYSNFLFDRRYASVSLGLDWSPKL